MANNEDYLLLKWGTIEGFDFTNSPEAREAYKAYEKLGMSYSVMAQKDTKRQKELICLMIDKVNGPVSNGWDGTEYKNREDAKKYVMEYDID